MRLLLAPLRALLLLLHIFDGIAISGLIFPALDQCRRNRIIGAWSRGLVRICGARIRVTGVPLDPQLARDGVLPGSRGRLMLCNHISWIDVFALLGAMPSRFVAKSEIGRWPLIGFLVTLVGTLYIERGRRHAVAAMNHRVRERLHAGETIVVFAEGTTTDGFSLLPFHSNLIAPAIEVGCEIWPVALRYTLRGVQTTAAAFVGEMGLVMSLWNILVAPGIVIEVAYLAPLPVSPDRTRHHFAQRARAEIAAHLGFDPDPASGQNRAPQVSLHSASNGASAPIAGAGGAPTNPQPSPPADTAPARSPAPANASQ
jgi:1-acyl-sn-glycerol-3-phosphate acyltransferase